MVRQQVSAPRRAAAYIRVSTDDQTELSPESQLEEIRRYAQEAGIRLLEEHIYIDPGISGKRAEKRPAFMRMIAAAKAREPPFSVILLWKYSRFARNQEESVFYKSILRSKCGVEVISVTEPLAAGPFGSLMERIIEWMDEFYSIRLSQEVKRSMKVNAQRGRLQCAPAFGYEVRDGVLAPKAGEADWVRRIFARFTAGQTIRSIVRELNEAGIRTHRGNLFEDRAVSYILQNPVYTGLLRWNPEGPTCRDFRQPGIILSRGAHEALVDETVFQKAQEMLARGRTGRTFSHQEHMPGHGWLTGLVRCAACGAALIAASPRYCRCGGYARGRCSHAQHVPARLLEEAILSRLEADAGEAPTLVGMPLPEKGARREHLTNRLKALRIRGERLEEAYLAGAMELPAFTKQQKRLREEIGRTERELTDEASAENPSPVTVEAAAPLPFSHLDPERKAAAVRSVVASCALDREAGTLTIIYHLTLPGSSSDAIWGP